MKPKHTVSKRLALSRILKKRQKVGTYLRRSTRELKKKRPDLTKVQNLQKKVAKLLVKSIEQQKLFENGHYPSSDEEMENDQTNGNDGKENSVSFSLEKTSERHVKKYGAHSCSFSAKISVVEGSDNLLRNVMNELDNVFLDVIAQVKEKCHLDNPNDKMRVMISSNQLKKPLSTKLVGINEQTPNLILSEVSKVLQSDEEIGLDEGFSIEVVALKAPSGRGKRFKTTNFAKHNKLKKSIVSIRNSDAICCARAIVTGQAMALQSRRLKQIMRGRPVQTRLAKELHRKAQVPFHDCGLAEIDLFQNVLTDFQIKVISFASNNSLIYEGPKRNKKIILYFNDNHFDVINPKKLPAFFGKRYFCDKCNTYYNDIRTHPCFNMCKVCERKACVKTSVFIECQECHKFCRSQACMEAHKKDRTKNGKKYQSKCQKTFRCTKCSAIVPSKRKNSHQCGEFPCQNCKQTVMNPHLCFMTDQPSKGINENLIFFDFETHVTSGHEHKVNFGVAQDFEGNISMFEGENALDEFCQFLFDDKHKHFTAIAHNAKAFDSLFLLQWLMTNRPTADIRIIRSGLKILQLFVKELDIRVIDSLNWFQMPLSKLPKTFGLDESTFKKGDFPHLFNKKENWSYIGPLPDLKYFSPDDLNSEKRLQLVEWHGEMRNANYVFDFQHELESYCKQDVAILRACCLKFRLLFLNEMSIDVFQYITIASTVMAIFRSKFLKPNTIAVVPSHLYRGVQKMNSEISIQWLEFLGYCENKRIQHAGNKGEYKIHDPVSGKTFYVDGFCEETHEVLEFYGCVFHSHLKHHEPESFNVIRKNVKNSCIYQDTLKREKQIRDLGYKVRFIWECDFIKLSQTPEFIDFISTHDLVSPLSPRDAFFGGRTNGVKLYYKCKPGKKIKYVDFCSLYPFVNANRRYPVGHPRLITENFGDITQYFGLIKCKVLPPEGLYFPVLPVKMLGKLFFPLCKQCVVDNTNFKFQCLVLQSF